MVSSIHSLGLIAITKPWLSIQFPGLYNDFKSWMKDNGVQREGFKGFVADWFGKIAELAQKYLKWGDSIQAFFSAIVDINSIRLVLAVSTFIHNDWFTCCSEICSIMADLVIYPMLELLRNDKKGAKVVLTERVQELRPSLRTNWVNWKS